ncbi:MAG TPA: phosphotransferase [Pseudomonadales bacterium]
MPTPPIPAPDEIDREWLTARLRDAGHGDVDVRAFTATRIGTGQIGQCIRYELELSGGEAPRRLVGKFPSDDPLSRETGVGLRNYYREVQFYRTLAPRLPIATPRCYYAAIDGEGPRFVLLLEDMHPAVQGDQLAGCSPEVARSAVRELVGLQAPTWCDETLLDYDWLHQPAPATDLRSLYAQMLPGFVDRYGASLAPDEVDVLSRVADAPQCPLFAPLEPPFCLEHVDYRLDNLLIDHTTSTPRVTVVDWQSVKVGRPLNDVAYCLGGGLEPDVRRPVEQDIVRDYHRALEAAGVTGFDWPSCWEAYRRSTFAGFGVTVIASMIVEQTPRGDEMFLTMARRHARHALDLGATEFLE